MTGVSTGVRTPEVLPSTAVPSTCKNQSPGMLFSNLEVTPSISSKVNQCLNISLHTRQLRTHPQWDTHFTALQTRRDDPLGVGGYGTRDGAEVDSHWHPDEDPGPPSICHGYRITLSRWAAKVRSRTGTVFAQLSLFFVMCRGFSWICSYS